MRVLRTEWSVALVAALLLSEAAHAGPILTVDQHIESVGAAGGLAGFNSGLGQSFRTRLSGIDAAEIVLGIGNAPSIDVTLRLLDGVVGFDGLAGSVLATSSTETITLSGPLAVPVHFDFPTTVPLTPGNTYVLQILYASTGFVDAHIGGNAIFLSGTPIQLVPGQAVSAGIFPGPIPFKTGLHSAVPEPSAVALFGLGAACLAVRRRRHLATRNLGRRRT